MKITRRHSFLSGLVFALALSGCADRNSQVGQVEVAKSSKLICSNGQVKIDGDSAGIVGGQILGKDTWLAKGVVYLLLGNEDPTTKEKSFFACTGILVDENIVLTAAHCVDRAGDKFKENLAAVFSSQPECDVASGAMTGKALKATGVKIHPSWKSQGGVRGDLALIRLSGKAPAGWKPLKLTSEFIEMDPSKNVLLSGYGQTNVDYHGAYSVNDAEGALLRVTQVKPFAGNTKDSEMLYVDQSHGTGICAGDSGGPSLMKNSEGKFVVTGVASFVQGMDENVSCGYSAAHTSVFKHRDWIDEAFKSLRDSNSTKNSLFE